MNQAKNAKHSDLLNSFQDGSSENLSNLLTNAQNVTPLHQEHRNYSEVPSNLQSSFEKKRFRRP